MKRISIFKRLLILVLVFILSINSFAAIVADNDGATFITKAEFDSLKNNFQAQIDNYNTSIDSKIEGAIASYLAGIKMNTTETVESVISAVYDRVQCHGDNSYFDFTTMAINYEFETIGGEGRRIEYNPFGYTSYTKPKTTNYTKSLIADIADLGNLDNVFNPAYRYSRCEGHITCFGWRNASNTEVVSKCVILCTSQLPSALSGGNPTDAFMNLPCSNPTIGSGTPYMTDCTYKADGITINSTILTNAFFGAPRFNIITPPDTYRGAFNYSKNVTNFCSNSFRTSVLEDPTKSRTLCTVTPGSSRKDILLYQETETTGVLGFFPGYESSCNVSQLGGANTLKYFVVGASNSGLTSAGYQEWSWTDYGTSNSYGLVTDWVSPRWLFSAGSDPFTKIKYNNKILKTNEGIIQSYYPLDGNSGTSMNLGVPLIYTKKPGELIIDIEMEDNTKNYNFWFSKGPMVNKDLTVAANRPTNIIKPKVDKNSYDGITITGSRTVKLDIDSECLVYVAWTEDGKIGGGTLKLPVSGIMTYTE